ncbi:MAG: potassium channel protein [Chitinophagaceae bacterium]|nr:potassium channel protein [Chitinophagaceae bacterium]
MFFIKRLNLFKGLFVPILLMGGLVMAGSLGYMIIEHYGFLEAVYMTIITVGSVGFQEVRPLHESGRIFTIFLIVLNLGLFTYFITLLSRYFFDLEFIKKYKLFKMENSIQKLQGHVIICGFGRNGKECAQVLHDNGIQFVVLEEKIEDFSDVGFAVDYFLKGDATKDEALLEAGVKNARALISALPVDADNLFVVLSAKQLNPGLMIISRASQDSSVSKLKIAGATNVIMPDKIGGAHMATLVMLPDVVELLSIMATRNNEKFKIVEKVTEKNISLAELDLWNKTNCTILGIKDEDNNYTVNPAASHIILPGQKIIIMGNDEQIKNANKLI